jgi:predicted PurR-regulated permease PerM
MPRISSSKALRVLLLLISVVVILYYAKTLLIPLAFGAFFAMVFHPLAEKMGGYGIPRWGAITLSVLIFILALSTIMGIVFFQTRSLVKDWPTIKEQLVKRQEQLEAYVIQNTGIASEERIARAKKMLSNQQKQFFTLAGGFAGSIFSTLSGLALAIVYMVFIMMARDRLQRFVEKLVPEGQHEKARAAMHEARKASSQFMIGRLVVMGVLAVLYVIGFLVFGLQYAVPLALLVSLLSIIPYLGNIIGVVFVVAVAMATGADTTTMAGALGTIVLAQVLENNVLTPWIMSREVSLNPLTTFTAIIGLGLVWGVAGTILAVPMAGAIKKIFDHIDALQPIGYLLGTEKE